MKPEGRHTLDSGIRVRSGAVGIAEAKEAYGSVETQKETKEPKLDIRAASIQKPCNFFGSLLTSKGERRHVPGPPAFAECVRANTKRIAKKAQMMDRMTVVRGPGVSGEPAFHFG